MTDSGGLYYLRARYYDPTTAQFLSGDPMIAMTRSPYAYVSGNPLNASDPTGKYGELPPGWNEMGALDKLLWRAEELNFRIGNLISFNDGDPGHA